MASTSIDFSCKFIFDFMTIKIKYMSFMFDSLEIIKQMNVGDLSSNLKFN